MSLVERVSAPSMTPLAYTRPTIVVPVLVARGKIDPLLTEEDDDACCCWMSAFRWTLSNANPPGATSSTMRDEVVSSDMLSMGYEEGGAARRD